MDGSSRIGIVGAGAWGLSAALALAEAGFNDLHLWEAHQAGSGATSRAAGLVSTHLRQESDIRLVIETRKRLADLQAWGIERGEASAPHCFRAVGGLTVVPQKEADKLDRLAARIRHCGGEAQRWEPPELEKGPWPLKSVNHLSGLFTPHDGTVEAGDLASLLRARLRALGVKIHEEAPADLLIDAGQCQGVKLAGEVVRLDRVLLSAGAWTKAIAARSGVGLPLKAYRTQLAQLEFPHGEELPILHDTEQHVYARPDGPGRVLAGDGTEFVEREPEAFNRSADAAFIEKIARAASRRWRGGTEARYRTGWAGLCVATPDRNPLIGPAPGVKGLFLMAGDNGFGVMRCLALGRVAAARIMGKMVPGAELYDPRRCAGVAEFDIREGFEL